MNRSKWLLLDVGNTHTVAGVYAEPGPEPRPEPKARAERLHAAARTSIAQVRFRTDLQTTPDEYRMWLAQLFTYSVHNTTGMLDRDFWASVSRVILSTVVPPLEAVIQRAAKDIPFLSVHASCKRDFELQKLPFPEQLGADRLANVAGALVMAEPPFLIVDAGTATTFCLVDRHRQYIGGAISPGLEIGWKALQARAARLFSVELIRPATAIGNTTETQLTSGVLLGYENLIEGLCDRLMADAVRVDPDFKNAQWIGTGGCIQMLKLSDRFKVVEDLTLLGLLRYGQLNP